MSGSLVAVNNAFVDHAVDGIFRCRFVERRSGLSVLAGL